MNADISVISFGLHDDSVQAFSHDKIRSEVTGFPGQSDMTVSHPAETVFQVFFKLPAAHAVNVSGMVMEMTAEKKQEGRRRYRQKEQIGRMSFIKGLQSGAAGENDAEKPSARPEQCKGYGMFHRNIINDFAKVHSCVPDKSCEMIVFQRKRQR